MHVDLHSLGEMNLKLPKANDTWQHMRSTHLSKKSHRAEVTVHIFVWHFSLLVKWSWLAPMTFKI